MNEFDNDVEVAWCPGCGDYGILTAVKLALSELKINKKDLVMVSGIGQAAKLVQYVDSNVFNGLHGRPLPAATAIKASNNQLNVLVTSGDGDLYGEGGNHLIHTIRRNPNITVIAHNNMIYGLTKGQASPTSLKGMKTPVQVDGVFNEPFNPISMAISQDASFVARANAGDVAKTVAIIKQAIMHKGFSLVDIFQPCVTFNKQNTYQWFKEHTYYLDDKYNPTNRVEAFRKSIEFDPMPLGVIYKKDKQTFEEHLVSYDDKPLYKNEFDIKKFNLHINKFRN